VVIHGRDRLVDAGELDGRLFFNIAGIGFDAVVAEEFNARGTIGNRGMGPYVRIGIRQVFRYRAGTYRVTLDGDEFVSNALVIAFANGREYGNRIRVAPQALVDDGKLEAVVMEDRGPLSRLWAGRHLALGTADKSRAGDGAVDRVRAGRNRRRHPVSPGRRSGTGPRRRDGPHPAGPVESPGSVARCEARRGRG
jgi:diacylglycerol kinase family enzyme